MFPCHRSHSWISGGDHFLDKNPQGSAFAIIENGLSWLFSTKMRVMCHLSSTRGSYTSPHKCIRNYWKWSLMAIFDKNGGCVSIYHRPEARTPHILGFLVETISWSKIRRCLPLLLLKMVVHGYFRQKLGLSGHWSSTRGSYTSPYICFLAIDHILGFLLETISWSKIGRC
jgi:hypothetical protein